tara:strand:+ start:18 stop:323 length:306 start_codon:yes stop_codon:yes gene_type:complete
MSEAWADEAPEIEVEDKPKRGRPKGSYNKASKAQIKRVCSDGGLSPLEYLASIYQDEGEDKRFRIEAAKAAAPYVHARLSSTEVKAALTEVSQEEWLESLN